MQQCFGITNDVFLFFFFFFLYPHRCYSTLTPAHVPLLSRFLLIFQRWKCLFSARRRILRSSPRKRCGEDACKTSNETRFALWRAMGNVERLFFSRKRALYSKVAFSSPFDACPWKSPSRSAEFSYFSFSFFFFFCFSSVRETRVGIKK